jgi:hypothetical protein
LCYGQDVDTGNFRSETADKWLGGGDWRGVGGGEGYFVLNITLLNVESNNSPYSNPHKSQAYLLWAMPDKSVTSDTGLTLMPECQCRIDQIDYGKNANAEPTISLVFRHLLILAELEKPTELRCTQRSEAVTS